MQLTRISTSHAPAAIGPYSQAIRTGEFVYVSGQIALDPANGELAGDDVQAQTHRVVQNLQAILTNAGASLASVVKTTVFLARMSDFQAMNAVYATYFEGPGRVAPARSTVAVAELPRKALVEIECVALVEG
jgi:2-iminobutanoate/2-iminopropanoate deaminase